MNSLRTGSFARYSQRQTHDETGLNLGLELLSSDQSTSSHPHAECLGGGARHPMKASELSCQVQMSLLVLTRGAGRGEGEGAIHM
jgi:hypothetical protein